MFEDTESNENKTICGKYSYGPLCNHPYVKKVGSFTSIARGANVVENHPVQYISTHPFIYYGNNKNDELLSCYKEYNFYKNAEWYFDGVKPKGDYYKFKRVEIGNDVWIGANVIITNGSNIGNGAIIGAGSIVTKDVPDYAIAVGNPARIIKYRYKKEFIEKLNEIRWGDWPDNIIRQRYNDFYLPIEEFTNKYIHKPIDMEN